MSALTTDDAHQAERAWMFDGFDVRAWARQGLFHLNIFALFADRDLVLEEIDSNDDETGSPIAGAYVKPPESNDAHTYFCHDGEFDRSCADERRGYEGERKRLAPRAAVLSCECEECGGVTTAEMLVRYLRAGLITLDDLLNPAYGYTPLPAGFVINPDIDTDIHEVWKEYDPFLTKAVKKIEEEEAEEEELQGYIIGRHKYNNDKKRKAREDSAKTHYRRVCGYFRVDARTFDETGKAIGYRLTYYETAGKLRFHDITEALVDGEGAALFQELDRLSLNVSHEPRGRAALRRLIKTFDTGGRRIVLYSRPGWHHDNTLYLTLDGRSLGEVRNARATLQSEVMVEPVEYADLDGARSEYCSRFVDEIWKGDTDQFAFGMLVGCCGVLSSLAQMPAPAFLFQGKTSIGKTLTQIISAGCVANPEHGQGVLITADGDIERGQRRASGTCLHVDDKKTGKLNVERYGYSAATQTQTPTTLSSEQTLEELVGSDIQAGLTVRLLEIKFESIPRIDPARADAIELAAKSLYGLLLVPFVKEVMRQGWHQDVAALRDQINAYADAYCLGVPADRLAEWRRAAKAFAVVRLAGDVILDMGVLPDGVTATDVDRVVRWAWDSYVGGRRDPQEPVRDSIEAFDRWLQRRDHDIQPLAAERSGRALAWVSEDGTAYVRASSISRIPGVFLDRKALIHALKSRGRLVQGAPKQRNLTWEVVPGHGRIRHYRVKTSPR